MKEINYYTPNSLYQKGLINLISTILKDLIKNKELIWRMFLRDFSARYKQSLLGWGWILLMPIFTMGTFLLLNMSGIIKIGEIDVPYPIFGLLSYSIWNIFANGLSAATVSVTGAGGLVQKINFSKDTLVFASIGQIIMDFLIRIGLVILTYFVYGKVPSGTVLLFPLLLLPLLLLTLGLGLITSLFQCISKDVLSFINLGSSFLLLLMPIMYSAYQGGILEKINKFNPLYYLVISPRDMMLYGNFSDWLPWLLSSLLAIAIFMIGWLFFYLSQSKLAERI